MGANNHGDPVMATPLVFVFKRIFKGPVRPVETAQFGAVQLTGEAVTVLAHIVQIDTLESLRQAEKFFCNHPV